MDWVIDLFGGGGIGTALSGITGMIGGYLAKRENRLLAELQNSHELKMAEVDQKAEERQLQAQIKMSELEQARIQTEGDVAMDVAQAESEANVKEIDAKAFADAMATAQKPTGVGWVDKFRAMTRPTMTWLLFIFVVVIFGVLHHRVGDLVGENATLMVELYVYLVQSAIYLFIMAISWWFMSRGEKSAEQIKALRQ